VKVLYTINDMYHLWHTRRPRSRQESRSYYRQKRPVRCVMGLVRPPEATGEPACMETSSTS
jgi:hypothetical protein